MLDEYSRKFAKNRRSPGKAASARAVLIGVGTVVAAQFTFTYLPLLQVVFETRPIGLLEGIAIVALGVALLAIVEAEKRLVGLFGTAGAPLQR